MGVQTQARAGVLTLLGEAARYLVRGALGLLYPFHCYLCNKPIESGYLCPECYAGLPRLCPPLALASASPSISGSTPGAICGRCGLPLEDPKVDLCDGCAGRPWFFEQARSFGFYEAGLEELIKGFKFKGERALARELARYLFEAGGELLAQAEALTFVPMTRRRLRSRGFNQAELLARELGRLTGLPVVPALVKVRETEDQVSLRPDERWKNVQGAFAAVDLDGVGRFDRILLIDDVYTTGATAEECSRALREGGYSTVFVLTVARTRPRPEPKPELKPKGKEAGDGA